MITKRTRWLVCAAMLSLAGLSACAVDSLVSDTGVPPPIAQVPQPQPLGSYVLQVGDVLGVKFYNNTDLNEDVVVRPDGMISMQLIGDVAALGLSPQALAAELTHRYKSELANPRISVIVRELGAAPVYVGGEVGKPGIVGLTSGMTLFQSIQAAGGLLVTAHQKQVILIRRESDGRRAGYSIDVRPILTGKDPQVDVPLGPYDVVFVPTSKIADVNTFVDQYISRVIPRLPIAFAIAPF